MNNSDIMSKREKLKNAMSDLCKQAEADSELCKKIKDRNFWVRLFSNNTQDLAKANIAQIKLIEQVQFSIQDLMAIVKDSNERERQIVAAIDDLRSSGDRSFTELTTTVGKLIQAVIKGHIEFERIKINVDAGESITDSKAAAAKCASFIVEYCKRADTVNIEELCRLLKETITTNFIQKGILLRNEDKQTLLHEILEVSNTDWELILEQELEKFSPEGDRYSQFRDELVGIIDEFVSHKEEVDPLGKSIQQLEKTKKQLLESQFEIALIGEFQGGKSTTFNALCGGREISPRGLGSGGIKTSAAVITAQNIAGNETKNGMSEWAEITWLSKKSLQYRVAYALNLENSKKLPSLKELKMAMEKAWYNLDPDDDDTRDILQIATLQLRLLMSPDFEKHTSRNIVAIDEFQKYVKFPKDWEVRWSGKGINANFTLEESLFSALDSVLIRIHSKYLQKLGCRITDCPGLFVSKWDTDRALEVMSRSNAVWYLLNGVHEMGKEQKKVLQSIRQGGWHPKCFFTLNVRGDESSTDAILRANNAKIKNAGFSIGNRVFQYNAAVAFRLAQMECVSKGHFSKLDIDCLAIESSNKRVKYDEILARLTKNDASSRIQAIRELIYKALIPTGYFDSISHPKMTDEELSADLKSFAGLDSIARCLERHITTHGASSILLGDSGSGAELCKHVLEILRADKKAEEEAAQKDFVKAKARWEEDERRFLKFKNSVAKEFKFLEENTKLDDDFLADFYNSSWSDIKKNAETVAIDILIEEWRRFYWTNTGIKETAAKRINEEFSRIFKLGLDLYGKKISSTELYQNEIAERIQLSWKDLKAEWEEMEKENPHFEGLCPDDDVITVEIKPFEASINQNIEVPSLFFEFFRNIGNKIASWFGGKREDSEEHLIKIFREKDIIGTALSELKNSYFQSVEFKKLFAQARIQNKEKIDDAIQCSEQKFHERIEKEKLDMSESDEVRQQKAEEARRVREEIIEPRITILTKYMAKVKAAYGK